MAWMHQLFCSLAMSFCIRMSTSVPVSSIFAVTLSSIMKRLTTEPGLTDNNRYLPCFKLIAVASVAKLALQNTCVCKTKFKHDYRSMPKIFSGTAFVNATVSLCSSTQQDLL